MKIYLISQSVNNDYDTYDSFVVYAENEEKARLVRTLSDSWVEDAKDIKVEYLGEAKGDAIEGTILGSFNAG